MEGIEVRRRTEGGEKWRQFPGVDEAVKFPDPFSELPELLKPANFTATDVNGEQPVACMSKDHIEEWGGGVLEADDGP